jgi:hypothetical protein
MDVAADITTNGGAINLSAPAIAGVGTAGPRISTNGGAVAITSPGVAASPGVIASPGTIFGLNGSPSRINIDASSSTALGGAVTVFAGSTIEVGTIAGGSVNVSAPGPLTTDAISATGAVLLTSVVPTPAGGFTGSSIITGNVDTGGAALTADAFTSIALQNVQTGGWHGQPDVEEQRREHGDDIERKRHGECVRQVRAVLPARA